MITDLIEHLDRAAEIYSLAAIQNTITFFFLQSLVKKSAQISYKNTHPFLNKSISTFPCPSGVV